MPEDEGRQKNFSTYIDTIIRQVDDIGRLVNEFSAFARMPAPVIEDHDLVTMIDGQIKLLEAAEKDVAFTVDVSTDRPIIMACDDGMIRQVITNLVQNAIDAMREEGVRRSRCWCGSPIVMTRSSSMLPITARACPRRQGI